VAVCSGVGASRPGCAPVILGRPGKRGTMFGAAQPIRLLVSHFAGRNCCLWAELR
jgi:hypothetical protein